MEAPPQIEPTPDRRTDLSLVAVHVVYSLLGRVAYTAVPLHVHRQDQAEVGRNGIVADRHFLHPNSFRSTMSNSIAQFAPVSI